jgi:superfamily I DNA/RNA helicase
VAATSDCVASTALASATGDVLLTLDERQEQLARSIGDGHRVFFGVAGSGKTLLLLARAKLLAEAGERRVLVLCFNKVLASWLRSVIAEGAITNPKHAAIEVLHFNAWASQILGSLGFLNDIAKEDRDGILGERLLNSLEQPGSKRYDSILVDEAHTFDPTWFKCCVQALGDEANGNLMIVSDGSQSLYRRDKFTWKNVGVIASGRTYSRRFRLHINYRSTRQILEAAWSVLQPIYQGGDGEAETVEDTFPVVTPDIARAGRSGPRPRLVKGVLGKNMICREIKDLRSQGYCAQDIALIYPKHADWTWLTAELLKGVRDELGKDSNIGAIWITETEKTKERFSASDRGVRILTAHSALGLEFKAVVIVGLDLFQYGNGGIQEDERKLLYVAMTRAQERLVLLHPQAASPMLREMQASGTVDTDGA